MQGNLNFEVFWEVSDFIINHWDVYAIKGPTNGILYALGKTLFAALVEKNPVK